MQLSPETIKLIEHMSDYNKHSSKFKPFSWDHIKDGYTGKFFKYNQGVTPIMKSAQVNEYLALIYCLVLQEKK